MDIKLLTFMNQSPVFKGVSLTILGIIALLFGIWMRNKNKKMDLSASWRIWIYIIISVAILFYGIFILIYKPLWWLPPQ